MKVDIAFKQKVRQLSFQDEFPKTTKCRCGGESRLAFVAHEMDENSEQEGGKFVCQLYDNKPNVMWLHDACAVAVYFCEKCLEPTALYNQA